MDMNEDTVMDLEFGWFHTFFSFNVFFLLFFNAVCFGMSPFGQGLNVDECHR